jgi:16S rRNA (guanine966-N2)-methyltransferase
MRITGGVHRSRLLHAPKGVSTRPTADRVREAMFSILASRRTLIDARVLDLYAGTGALGLEALSRGARHAVFVECSRTALGALQANVADLGALGSVRIVSGLVERSITSLSTDGPFDFILADPPYALVRNGEAIGALAEVVRAALLAEGGVVVLEHGKGDPLPRIEGLAAPDIRVYGDTLLAFYTGEASVSGGP